MADVDELKAMVAAAVSEATTASPVTVNSQGTTLRQVAVYGLAGLAAIAIVAMIWGKDLNANGAVIAIVTAIVTCLTQAVATAIGAKATSQPTTPVSGSRS